jgi:hypothetical protein
VTCTAGVLASARAWEGKPLALRTLIFCLIALAGASAPGFLRAAPQSAASVPFATIFRSGTLDALPPGTDLLYGMERTMPPEAPTVSQAGQLRLRLADELVSLELSHGDTSRVIVESNAGSGNPLLLFFFEGVVRDMARITGGSPFYIRNRIKAALMDPAPVEAGRATYRGETVATEFIVLAPFASDPNGERMAGFDALELRFTFSEDVPGWYFALDARVPAAEGGARYALSLDLVASEAAQ